MASQRWISGVLSFSVLVLGALALSSKTPSAGHADDVQAIRQLNEQCLHAHDIGDAVTLDRIEDADFTLSGDFGVVSKQQQLDEVRHRTGTPEVVTRKIDPQQFRFYNGVALMTETDRPTTRYGNVRVPVNGSVGPSRRLVETLSISITRVRRRSSRHFWVQKVRATNGVVGREAMFTTLTGLAALSFSIGGYFMKLAGLTHLRPTVLMFAFFSVGTVLQTVAMRGEQMAITYIVVLGLKPSQPLS